MPVDTRNKRASASNLFTPLPLADSVVAAGDRAQVSWVYVGLVTGGAAPPPPVDVPDADFLVSDGRGIVVMLTGHPDIASLNTDRDSVDLVGV